MTSSTWHRAALPIDQQLALRTSAVHLAREFDGSSFGAETIERFLHSSYDEFAGRAVVLNFLPLLADPGTETARSSRGLCARGIAG